MYVQDPAIFFGTMEFGALLFAKPTIIMFGIENSVYFEKVVFVCVVVFMKWYYFSSLFLNRIFNGNFYRLISMIAFIKTPIQKKYIPT